MPNPCLISYGTLGGTSERGSCRPVPLSDESMRVCVCVCVWGGGGGGGGGGGVQVCGYMYMDVGYMHVCIHSYGVHLSATELHDYIYMHFRVCMCVCACVCVCVCVCGGRGRSKMVFSLFLSRRSSAPRPHHKIPCVAGALVRCCPRPPWSWPCCETPLHCPHLSGC